MNRILIVDDHVLFREGLCHLMAHWDDFEVVGDACNGEQAITVVRETQPNLVLMDIHMPVMDGIEATRRITREFPAIHIVILTVSEDESTLFEALKAGARGYVLKNTPSRRLHDLLRGVMYGETPFSGVMATKILAEFNRGEAKPASAQATRAELLTERETQVLKLVVAGQSNTEIASQMGLAEITVKKYFHNILQKLQLSNRVEVAVYAVREGLVNE